MARATAARGSGVVAGGTTTLLLLLLLLLLMPAPASSQAAAGLRALAKAPFLKKIGKSLAKEAATAGGSALLKQEMGRSNGGGNRDRLGAAAADNAGTIVYSVSVEGQSISGAVTIFKDFTWVQCPAAISSVPCTSATCTSVLDISADDCDSSSMCEYEYGSTDDDTNTSGYLASETFAAVAAGTGTTTTTTPVSVVFGCSTALPPDGETGAIGFSKGSLSVPTQLGVSKFSYFLTPDDSSTSEATSVVLLGEQAVPQTKHSRSTPLLDSTNLAYPDLYYVQLTGIQVDGEPLTGIPAGAFDVAEDGSSGGVVLSTTTAITYLQGDAYDSLKQALVKSIKSDPAVSSSSSNSNGFFDLCYSINAVAELTFPEIKLVFAGEGSPAMELTTVHYFYKDADAELQCLTMLPMPSGQSVGTILGSMMQAGTNMIYDVGAMQLTFEKAAASLVNSTSQHVFLIAASMLLVLVFLF
uniref:Uncharacterized protein n=1 Tax=Avena sativa TaxID=4498 RepID=A0ACD5TL03_AVESA